MRVTTVMFQITRKPLHNSSSVVLVDEQKYHKSPVKRHEKNSRFYSNSEKRIFQHMLHILYTRRKKKTTNSYPLSTARNKLTSKHETDNKRKNCEYSFLMASPVICRSPNQTRKQYKEVALSATASTININKR